MDLEEYYKECMELEEYYKEYEVKYEKTLVEIIQSCLYVLDAYNFIYNFVVVKDYIKK
jgi:hypothetical protein